MALAAPEAVRILDAAGSDVVIVETVGVGQAEVDVAAATDTTLVVVAPGWGDAVQVAKAGILEVADVFVVNKSDRDGADAAVRDLEAMIRLGAPTDWTPPVVKASAAGGTAVEDVWAAIELHRTFLDREGRLAAARRRRLALEAASLAAERLRLRVRDAVQADGALADDLAERRLDPYRAAAMLLDRVAGTGDGG
jgi:LAO/AO transport system kinase